jgi:hypothetical protein
LRKGGFALHVASIRRDKSEPPEAGDVVEAGGARAPWTANGRERAVGCVGTVW